MAQTEISNTSILVKPNSIKLSTNRLSPAPTSIILAFKLRFKDLINSIESVGYF